MGPIDLNLLPMVGNAIALPGLDGMIEGYPGEGPIRRGNEIADEAEVAALVWKLEGDKDSPVPFVEVL